MKSSKLEAELLSIEEAMLWSPNDRYLSSEKRNDTEQECQISVSKYSSQHSRVDCTLI